eukprot:12259140-Alexandrium_andersonii.AAC.1
MRRRPRQRLHTPAISKHRHGALRESRCPISRVYLQTGDESSNKDLGSSMRNGASVRGPRRESPHGPSPCGRMRAAK